LVVAAIGIACLAIAVGANQRWLDRHFLPSFLWPRLWFTLIETSVRIGLAALGAWIVTDARRTIGRFAQRTPSLALHSAIAVVLALVAAEAALKYVKLQPGEWLFPDEEPRRQPDSRLGWVFVPSRTGHMMIGGRDIAYTFDAHGYRVASLDASVDLQRPTMLFAGESVMVGEGLRWDETIPAQVGATLGIPSANLAVHGYSTDQSYMRLETELPRFKRPLAVVTLFMTALFGRNLDRDRPSLGPGLAWRPARPRARLPSLLQMFVPYRSSETIATGVYLTREVLRATATLAHAHGAMSIILVPQFGHDDARDQALRRSIFDGTGLSYVFVEIDPGWRIPWDRHPDARAARAIADAVAAALHTFAPGQFDVDIKEGGVRTRRSADR